MVSQSRRPDRSVTGDSPHDATDQGLHGSPVAHLRGEVEGRHGVLQAGRRWQRSPLGGKVPELAWVATNGKPRVRHVTLRLPQVEEHLPVRRKGLLDPGFSSAQRARLTASGAIRLTGPDG